MCGMSYLSFSYFNFKDFVLHFYCLRGKEMKALILAGGYATRLWPLTKEKAKPLLLINGKPMITHIIEKIPADIQAYVATN